MKVKFLIAAALCLALPLFAACGKNDTTYDEFEDDTALSEEQTDGAEQSRTTEQSGGESPDDAESEEDTDEVTVMYITINSDKLEVTLAENSSAAALVEILKQNDINYTADDYGDFEKVGDIGYTLPRNDEQITTEPGDVILYQGCNICLYYGVNSWSFTRIGKINGYSTEQLKTLLRAGSGEIEVTLSLK